MRTQLASTVLLFSIASASNLDLDELLNSIKLPLSSSNLQKSFKASHLEKHAKKFQYFADRNGGTRVFGSPGYNASVEYVYTLAKLAGYDVQRQTFPYPYSQTLQESLTVDNISYNMTAMRDSPSGPKAGITAPLVFIPDTDAPPSSGCSIEDFAGVDVKGKIALIQRGTCSFAIKTANAKSSGAVGAVIYNNAPGALSGTLGGINDAAYVPVGGISQESGQVLIGKLAAGPVTAVLKLEFLREERYSSNVIATSKAGNHSNIVFIGGHLDSVQAGPGLNDDGSGSITVLELALNLAKFKLKNAVRFAWWTAEEFGLVGSTHYINGLSAEEKKKIALYINLDMVASPNPIYGVLDSDNSAGQNTAEGPLGSAAVESTLIEYFTANKLPTVPSNFNGRSDYAAFIANGIPSGGLFTGAEGIMTEEQAKLFKGEAGVAYDKNYHQPGDTINNLDYDAWFHNLKASAHAVATFINSTKRIDDIKKGAGAGAKRGLVTTSNEDLSVVQGNDYESI